MGLWAGSEVECGKEGFAPKSQDTHIQRTAGQQAGQEGRANYSFLWLLAFLDQRNKHFLEESGKNKVLIGGYPTSKRLI